jgi:Mor family transcriptional regulator
VSVSRIALRRHELLSDLSAVAEHWLLDQDVPAIAASVTAAGLVDHIVAHWAGQVISFPKDAHYKLTVRELEIYDKHVGDNADQLAREYGMTLRGMNKLLKRIRAKIKAANQDKAPPGQLDLLDPTTRAD